ncbi:hypothetical protein ONE63_001712 [Megalurothrips usitatus]|uniref:Uncharacterized protein n=1 Tax=Megalurothrips usitatus TaxID=439358 RepID=A0AAV7XDS9_9NEOP|nr:hypothetical protein ONE63_001712 [Megalurothrips usitatus]
MAIKCWLLPPLQPAIQDVGASLRAWTREPSLNLIQLCFSLLGFNIKGFVDSALNITAYSGLQTTLCVKKSVWHCPLTEMEALAVQIEDCCLEGCLDSSLNISFLDIQQYYLCCGCC